MNPAALSAALRGDVENMIAASTPGGIERQEAAGQHVIVKTTILPKQIRGATREQLTEAGFRFGEGVDDLFLSCFLPPGWTKGATDHSMYSNILDDKGRERGGIFYKAALYDRRADLTMKRRFSINSYSQGSTVDLVRTIVYSHGEEFHNVGESISSDYNAIRAADGKAAEWLQENYPDWKNPMAYWD